MDTNKRMKIYSSCVNWPRNDVPALCAMIDSNRLVSRRTFLRHVDREDLRELENGLGYETHHKRGLTMAADCCVSYHRSTLHGKRVYYFRQSAIEYVFKD